jgi:hypothetical protein
MQSNAIQTQIREIEAQNEKTRRRVRVALLILLVAGPLLLGAYPSVNLLKPTQLNLAMYAVVDLSMFGVIFFVVLFYFWSLLNKAQFSTLHVSSKSRGFWPQKAQKEPLNIIYALALLVFLGLTLNVLRDFKTS